MKIRTMVIVGASIIAAWTRSVTRRLEGGGWVTGVFWRDIGTAVFATCKLPRAQPCWVRRKSTRLLRAVRCATGPSGGVGSGYPMVRDSAVNRSHGTKPPPAPDGTDGGMMAKQIRGGRPTPVDMRPDRLARPADQPKASLAILTSSSWVALTSSLDAKELTAFCQSVTQLCLPAKPCTRDGTILSVVQSFIADFWYSS